MAMAHVPDDTLATMNRLMDLLYGPTEDSEMDARGKSLRLLSCVRPFEGHLLGLTGGCPLQSHGR